MFHLPFIIIGDKYEITHDNFVHTFYTLQMRKILSILLLFASSTIYAQMPGGMSRPGAIGKGAAMNVGHLYGKITEEKSKKGIDGATIQLIGSKFDTVTKKQTEITIKALISKANGDYSLENLPVFGHFKLRISAIGFKPIEQKVSFDLNMPKPGEAPSGGGMQQMLGMVDKDLGNIKMIVDASVLADVTVTSSKQMFEMGVDRKIFNVDKNLVSAGQTATEVMKTIPSLSVDIDGNVTLRNATPANNRSPGRNS